MPWAITTIPIAKKTRLMTVGSPPGINAGSVNQTQRKIAPKPEESIPKIIKNIAVIKCPPLI